MKNLIKFLFVFLSLSLAIVACNDDDDDKNQKPVVKELELGSSHDNPNNAIGYVGRDVHVGAHIFAQNKVAKIIITIHEEGHHHTKAEGGEETEWEVDTTYTNYKGELNPHFHEHIDIPQTAELGDYHFHFKVVDQQGLVTEVEKELQVKKK